MGFTDLAHNRSCSRDVADNAGLLWDGLLTLKYSYHRCDWMPEGYCTKGDRQKGRLCVKS
jgi:hypothetical protein